MNITAQPYFCIINKKLQRRPLLADIFTREELEEICGQIENRDIPKPEIIGALLNEEINIDLLENGLRITLENVSQKRKNSVYERFRDYQQLGTVFEFVVLGTLAKYFGDKNVSPYPDIGNGKSVEAKLIIEKHSIYIEVTELSFGKEEYCLYEKARNSPDGIAFGSISGTGEGRLIMKIKEKIRRYEPDVPNVLIVRQSSPMPIRGVELIRNYLNNDENLNQKRHWSGIFYLNKNEVNWLSNPNKMQSCSLKDKLVKQLDNSFKLLPSTITKKLG
jgi:hypothetical protein